MKYYFISNVFAYWLSLHQEHISQDSKTSCIYFFIAYISQGTHNALLLIESLLMPTQKSQSEN